MNPDSVGKLRCLFQCDVLKATLKRTEIRPAADDSEIFLGQAVANPRVS